MVVIRTGRDEAFNYAIKKSLVFPGILRGGAYALWESKKLKPMGMFPQIFKILLLEMTCEIFKFLQISQIWT